MLEVDTGWGRGFAERMPLGGDINVRLVGLVLGLVQVWNDFCGVLSTPSCDIMFGFVLGGRVGLAWGGSGCQLEVDKKAIIAKIDQCLCGSCDGGESAHKIIGGVIPITDREIQIFVGEGVLYISQSKVLDSGQ